MNPKISNDTYKKLLRDSVNSVVYQDEKGDYVLSLWDSEKIKNYPLTFDTKEQRRNEIIEELTPILNPYYAKYVCDRYRLWTRIYDYKNDPLHIFFNLPILRFSDCGNSTDYITSDIYDEESDIVYFIIDGNDGKKNIICHSRENLFQWLNEHAEFVVEPLLNSENEFIYYYGFVTGLFISAYIRDQLVKETKYKYSLKNKRNKVYYLKNTIATETNVNIITTISDIHKFDNIGNEINELFTQLREQEIDKYLSKELRQLPYAFILKEGVYLKENNDIFTLLEKLKQRYIDFNELYKLFIELYKINNKYIKKFGYKWIYFKVDLIQYLNNWDIEEYSKVVNDLKNKLNLIENEDTPVEQKQLLENKFMSISQDFLKKEYREIEILLESNKSLFNSVKYTYRLFVYMLYETRLGKTQLEYLGLDKSYENKDFTHNKPTEIKYPQQKIKLEKINKEIEENANK